jgi:hypothetical protein
MIEEASGKTGAAQSNIQNVFSQTAPGLYSAPLDENRAAGNGHENYDYYDESEYDTRNDEIQTLMVENQTLRRNQAQRSGQSSQFIQGRGVQPPQPAPSLASQTDLISTMLAQTFSKLNALDQFAVTRANPSRTGNGSKSDETDF